MATSHCGESIVAGFYVERHTGPDPGCEEDGRWSPEAATLGKEAKMDNRQHINAGASEATTAGTSWLNIVLGIWVIISPFVVQFARLPAAMWNNVIVGIVIAVLAIIRTSAPRQTGWSWVNVILGIWMIISPFVLGVMTTALFWNNIILGIVIALIAWGNASLRTPVAA
jgi:hypothetical protein